MSAPVDAAHCIGDLPGVWPEWCSVCGRRFRTEQELKDHRHAKDISDE